MSAIKDISGLNPEIQKMIKNDRASKSSANAKTQRVEENSESNGIKDSVAVSDEAKELLSADVDTERFVNTVKNAETTSRQDIIQLKTDVGNGKYTDQKVIDTIAEKLLGLPNFLDLE